MAISPPQVPEAHLSTPTYVPAQTLSDATRYLCCAAYVDSEFANKVIEEVVEDEHRAVPPSYGFDLDPVVRHCLRARRFLLGRHAVVTGLIIVGLCGTPFYTFFYTLALLAFGGAVLAYRLRLSLEVRIRIIAVLGIVAVLACLAGVFLSYSLNVRGGSFGDDWGPAGYGSGGTALNSAQVTGLLPLPLLLGVATFFALFLFRRHTYVVLADELAHGAPASRPTVRSARIERRLAAVAAAQRGNISVQERDPFLGSGSVMHGWSFAITLRPASPSGPAKTDGARGKAGTRGKAGVPDDGARRDADARIDLDAVELNQRVRQALLRLRDPDLPERARVPGIFLTSHVVAAGVRRQDDPLIDPVTGMPHTLASEAAITAITRCPQGGLRCYVRAVVPAAGKAIVADDGSPVLPGQGLGIDISGYVHLAVEGGMLYAEFMGTVLTPIRTGYQLVDILRPERVTGMAFRDTLASFVTDIVRSPWWLVRAGRRSLTLRRRMNAAREARQHFRAYDYGARLSVRDLGAEPELVKFLQTLDGWKYIKLIDKAATEAVIDFLRENGVDTAEFASSVTHIHNEYGSVINISGGQQNFGDGNPSFTQQNAGSA